MIELGKKAKEAARILKTVSTDAKNRVLQTAAKKLREDTDAVLTANAADIAAANGLSDAQKDRLKLDAARVEAVAKSIEKIAELPDPVGDITCKWKAPAGFEINRVRVPLGVIGVIFESRPNVTADAAALCIKSGNACILRPGSESFNSSRAIAAVFEKALVECGLPEGAAQMVPTPEREAVGELLRMRDYVDVIIPRGGKSLIARVQEESRVPVLAHLDGNCHVYVDGGADLEMAKRVALNAKMRRTGICGAAETLLVDKACAETHLAPLVKILLDAGCEVRGDAETKKTDARVKTASEEDWATEYLDAIISVKVVDGVKEAVGHIEKYGSRHTDSIITGNDEAAEYFLREVDSAIVMRNASTQFADGGEFGMGAEIGIATGRLHARGPVGLEQLTTYKYVIHGHGEIRAL